MTAAYEAALAKRQQVRSKTGINPNAEFQAGWEAAMRELTNMFMQKTAEWEGGR